MKRRDQDGWLDLHVELAEALGGRTPHARTPPGETDFEAPLVPVLTEPIDPRILYGYGDPAVVRADGPDEDPHWRMIVTSNDAPDVFPVLRSDDLETWTLAGFAYPRGTAPEWCETREGVADFWAPELHRAGGRWLLAFSARDLDGAMAVAVAWADEPEGPFHGAEKPLVTGGAIDAHLVVDRDGRAWLMWKEDDNGVWPGVTARAVAEDPPLAERLFERPEDAVTARICAALTVETPDLKPMEGFYAVQPLIDAAAEDLPAFRRRLVEAAREHPELVEAARTLDTRILARRLNLETLELEGETKVVLVNDQDWEAHLIEGVWVAEIEGTWTLYYAGNDFSTERYGVGRAEARHPLGPYDKCPEPFLRSTTEWAGPGHPSVTRDADDRPVMFLHAYRPGRTGYGVFRAALRLDL